MTFTRRLVFIESNGNVTDGGANKALPAFLLSLSPSDKQIEQTCRHLDIYLTDGT